jgi:hypothetical protein
MIVAGGVYREVCDYPHWDRLFGSGFRAAAAASSLSKDVTLVGYAPPEWAEDINLSASAFGVKARLTECRMSVTFRYFHPLSTAELRYGGEADLEPLRVEGDAVLRFGMVAGSAVVHARHAVFDPQTGNLPESFRANGSTAERLAIVLNGWEAAQATGLPPEQSGALIMARENADVVIIKLGPRGAMVHSAEGTVLVPPYRADRVFKIGSGDVFSAAFTYYWAEVGIRAAEAADAASRSVAHFVNGHQLPLPAIDSLRHGAAYAVGGEAKQLYLAGPFFTLAQRWLVEETRDILISMGVPVFSPLHDVGTLKSPRHLATGDLAGLDGSAVMLAILDGADPGTMFEVGYARKADIPVVGFSERLEDFNLTMLEGTSCMIEGDYTTAIYKAAMMAFAS